MGRWVWGCGSAFPGPAHPAARSRPSPGAGRPATRCDAAPRGATSIPGGVSDTRDRCASPAPRISQEKCCQLKSCDGQARDCEVPHPAFHRRSAVSLRAATVRPATATAEPLTGLRRWTAGGFGVGTRLRGFRRCVFRALSIRRSTGHAASDYHGRRRVGESCPSSDRTKLNSVLCHATNGGVQP